MYNVETGRGFVPLSFGHLFNGVCLSTRLINVFPFLPTFRGTQSVRNSLAVYYLTAKMRESASQL